MTIEEEMFAELEQAFKSNIPPYARTAKDLAEELGVTTHQVAATLRGMIAEGTWAGAYRTDSNRGSKLYWKVDNDTGTLDR